MLTAKDIAEGQNLDLQGWVRVLMPGAAARKHSGQTASEGGFRMARIQGAEPKGLFTRLVYSFVKRKLGRVVMPVRIVAHHSKILWGYTQMERSLAFSHLTGSTLKNLAQLRVATLIGCPF